MPENRHHHHSWPTERVYRDTILRGLIAGVVRALLDKLLDSVH